MSCKICTLRRKADRESKTHPLPTPAIPDALEFRRDQYGWTRAKMASELGIQRSHYTEVIDGDRRLPLNARIRAYAIGVPASVLLQTNHQ